MNPAHFGEWELDQIDWLVAHGTTRKAAERIMHVAKADAIRDARAAEDDRQFVIDYKELGSAKMGQRFGKSGEWARVKFTTLISQENPQENLGRELQSS